MGVSSASPEPIFKTTSSIQTLICDFLNDFLRAISSNPHPLIDSGTPFLATTKTWDRRLSPAFRPYRQNRPQPSFRTE